MKIRLVDFLVLAMGAYRAVGARLRPVVGVLLPQALGLGCYNVEMSTGFCNLGSLRETLEYWEYGSHVCRWHGEDFVAVIIQDELMFEVPRGGDGRLRPTRGLKHSAFLRSSSPWQMTSLLAWRSARRALR